ncbi:DNA (cytosine-5-)-methyltransferase [Allosaccharopolyspora coralli]|uniref:DNA (cytosine-5-)-methyltransferase n=1 Tax=Allosaccharopolyspora coralli TaxID=2665642 RepID=A0A5Q3Q6N8_9PSEU|nr:DNA (cytosine-5-)-methyltransferase [Allosaccharopolyspora coralli]QGK70321.1 DNA (cytosine-5-)-methyltransferase [Allosaccharopolyspora coralli]
MGVVVGSLCTGYGGLDAGALNALGGGRVAWVADPDRHACVLLEDRLPGVPNLGDIREVDFSTVEPVDVLTAGFPCQDVSAAGKRVGIRHGNRSGLWFHVARAVRELRPALVVIENVAALRWRDGGLHIVLGDLHEAGYDCAWTSLKASDVGAAHRRERIFILGWPRDEEARTASPPANGEDVVDEPPVDWGPYEAAIRRWEAVMGRSAPYPVQTGQRGRPVLSSRFVEFLMGLEDGYLSSLDIRRTAQLRLLGNGVVPQQASHAIRSLLADGAVAARGDVEEGRAA